MNRYFLNPNARTVPAQAGLFSLDEYLEVGAFQVEPSPLIRLKGLASRIGITDVMVKDESSRLGMNAFKILGVSYAVGRLLGENGISRVRFYTKLMEEAEGQWAPEPAPDVVMVQAHPAAGDPVIVAGASGACGLAALLEVLRDEKLRPAREANGLNALSRVLVINTEGATDPELYERVTAASEFEH